MLWHILAVLHSADYVSALPDKGCRVLYIGCSIVHLQALRASNLSLLISKHKLVVGQQQKSLSVTETRLEHNSQAAASASKSSSLHHAANALKCISSILSASERIVEYIAMSNAANRNGRSEFQLTLRFSSRMF